jgi:DUF2075 family protein
MIVYQSTKTGFINDITSGNIDDIIKAKVLEKLNRNTGQSETDSWRNSLMYMNNVLNDPEIPNDSGISIECQIPQSSKRIDFIITGTNSNHQEHAIIIELKQWSKAEKTDKDGIVKTALGGNIRETSHPSYQAWSYAALLMNFNETIYTEDIQLKPCAFLHNYTPDGIITDNFYADYLQKAPVFLKNDQFKLREFIKQFVRYGDHKNLLFRIENGRIRPSKMLADSLVGMLKGKDEFVMIDDQKIIYETAMHMARNASKGQKKVLIIDGGPGTGKSVVAINLLVNLTKENKFVQYVTKNSAPRQVFESKLTGEFKKTVFSNLFRSSGAYTETPPDTIDALIVDEAHRLNEKSGMFSNLGENQVKEIIRSSLFSVFFIDENQRVAMSDIGTKGEIEMWAARLNASVYHQKLESQFRCGGSDGYLAWLDNTLQIRETANPTLEGIDYDFRVLDSPSELRKLITEKNEINNKSRIVAGYCYPWNSKKDKSQYDIVFPEHDFAMRWNLTDDGMLWILKPESVNEVGCIHTCQGLELDYVGVIIGKDLLINDNFLFADHSGRASSDKTVHGFKKLKKENPAAAVEAINAIVKNTYRTLMTRGIKGCYVYAEDENLREWLKESVGR